MLSAFAWTFAAIGADDAEGEHDQQRDHGDGLDGVPVVRAAPGGQLPAGGVEAGQQQ